MARQLRLLCLYMAAAVCCQGFLAAAAAPPTAMAGISEIQDASQVVRMMSATDEVKEYLSDPKTVCTGFLPTNQALVISTQQLGRYASRLAQNETRVAMLLNYHIIPDVALSSAQLKDGMKLTTREGEPMHILVKDNQTYVYSNPRFPAALVKLNFPAGKCVVHTVERVLPPPSWAAEMEEIHARVVAEKAGQAAGSDAAGSSSTPAAAPAGAAASPPPAKSSAMGVATSAALAGAAAAAVVALAL